MEIDEFRQEPTSGMQLSLLAIHAPRCQLSAFTTCANSRSHSHGKAPEVAYVVNEEWASRLFDWFVSAERLEELKRQCERTKGDGESEVCAEVDIFL